MRTLLLFLPLVGAALLHAPVLRFDLLRRLKRPIDGGRTLGGVRIFGDNKTWRGAIVMVLGVLLAVWLLSHVDAYWSRLAPAVQAAGPLRLGLVLGVAAVVGELPNSFLKRRLGIAPGAQARPRWSVLLAIYDQCDFVPVVWLALAPIWILPAAEAAISLAVVVLVHMVINVIGFAIGARTTWI